MCFRPPSTQKPVKCPQCGALNPAISKKCIKCKTELTSEKPELEGNKAESEGNKPESGSNKPELESDKQI